MTIPDSVTKIGGSAFSNCSRLASVIFEGNAPTVGSNVFEDVANGCMAIVHRNSTGWVVEEGEKWNGLTLRYSTYTLTLNPNGGTYKSKTTAYKIPNSSQPAEPTYGKNYYWRVDAATRFRRRRLCRTGPSGA